jgi:hypothetical protein
LNPSGSALVYSSYLGGNSEDEALGIAIDSAGNAYVTGQTFSPLFPSSPASARFPTTPGTFQTAYGGAGDAFVTKVNPSGTALAYSSYLGGSKRDGGFDLAIRADGSAYVTGRTEAIDFPTTVGAFQTALAGSPPGFSNEDAFVTKVNAEGSALVYSSYLGGIGHEQGMGIAVGADGAAYATGFTFNVSGQAQNFPTTAGSFQTTFGGGAMDAFVTKFNATGSALVYSSYLGGNGSEGSGVTPSITADADGNAYVTSLTSSTDFPTTTGAFQTAYGGGSSDAFVSRVNGGGSALTYSSYLGGCDSDGGVGIGVDAGGAVYLAGVTSSATFPTTSGAFQTTMGGGSDAFVTKLDFGPVEQPFVPPCTGTIVVAKKTEPDGSEQVFNFSGAITATLGDGQSKDEVVAAGTHTVSELVPEGWDASAIVCSDPSGDSTTSLVPVSPGGTASATFRVAAGETVTCTFTNRKRGSVTLLKTTNGIVDPTKDILFILTGPGLPVGGIARSTFGDQDGVLEFRGVISTGTNPSKIYDVCETPVPAGFTSLWKLNGFIVTPYNPNAFPPPPQDLGTRCVAFSISTPGFHVAFEVDNSRPGGDPRTIGYWKNWNRCTGGNQAATAAKNGGAAAGFFLVEDLLPQLVGDFSVTTCQKAVKLLSKQDHGGKNKANDAAYALGAQLLAARFNLAAGAEVCSAIQQAVLNGQTLLDQITFTGSGDYLDSKSNSPLRPQALALASTIDRYNNGNLC